MKTLLFAYGLLQPAYQPPRTLGRWWQDRVRGQLFDLGPYPAAVQVGQGDAYFEGVVIEIDDSELAELDEFEEVDQGVYARLWTETELGSQVWIYEYRQPIPPNLKPQPRWPMPAD